jgi:hypothetical protein
MWTVVEWTISVALLCHPKSLENLSGEQYSRDAAYDDREDGLKVTGEAVSAYDLLGPQQAVGLDSL